MYYYSTVNDVVMTHSDIQDINGIDTVCVRFERPNKNGFDFAEGMIPHFTFQKSYGFNEDELLQFERYMRNNSALIWEFASKGGAENA